MEAAAGILMVSLMLNRVKGNDNILVYRKITSVYNSACKFEPYMHASKNTRVSYCSLHFALQFS